MSIFDIFTFKKQAQSVFSLENVKGLFSTARAAIVEQAKAKILGQEKKAKVDATVIYFIQSKTEHCTNGLVLWLIGLLIKSIPTITQAVYDYLKEKVASL